MCCRLPVLLDRALPRVSPFPWLSAGLRGSWTAKPRGCWCQGLCFAAAIAAGDRPPTGDGSTCQAPPRAQRSVCAASASSWPPNRTGWAKINTHLAGAAALRSLLREEAVWASAGSPLPRAGGSSSRGRPRCSPPVGDRRGTAGQPQSQRWRGLPPEAQLGSASQAARGGQQPPHWDVGHDTSPSTVGNPHGGMAGDSPQNTFAFTPFPLRLSLGTPCRGSAPPCPRHGGGHRAPA